MKSPAGYHIVDALSRSVCSRLMLVLRNDNHKRRSRMQALQRVIWVQSQSAETYWKRKLRQTSLIIIMFLWSSMYLILRRAFHVFHKYRVIRELSSWQDVTIWKFHKLHGIFLYYKYVYKQLNMHQFNLCMIWQDPKGISMQRWCQPRAMIIELTVCASHVPYYNSTDNGQITNSQLQKNCWVLWTSELCAWENSSLVKYWYQCFNVRACGSVQGFRWWIHEWLGSCQQAPVMSFCQMHPNQNSSSQEHYSFGRMTVVT